MPRRLCVFQTRRVNGTALCAAVTRVFESGVMAQEPTGLLDHPDFISAAQERLLVAEIERLTFSEVRVHGVTAKRRVAHFNWIRGR